MRVLVLGSGAREHALVWRLAADPGTSQVFCAPGNPGIGRLARLVDADPSDPGALLAVVRNERVDLTVVGPEMPLERGIADAFRAAGQPIVGPSQAAARLETSKVFAKDFMARHGVPTARYRVCASADQAQDVIRGEEFGYPVVVKADGLAAGKGVVVAADPAAASAAVRSSMVVRAFGTAGDRVVIEEFLEGTEASFFVLSDGRTALPLTSAQDHKRLSDQDLGPNTGGMGAFAPSPLVTPAVVGRVMQEIVEPVLDGLRSEGHDYAGVLYVGLMLTGTGPKVVEFNVRFGDPEAQVIIPMVEGSLTELLFAAATGDLASRRVAFSADRHVGVVMASAGYPGRIETGQAITGIDAAAGLPGVLVFQAGTAARDGTLVTSGGRVLTVVGCGRTYEQAIERAYDGVARISFDGMQYRRDIGRKALEQD